MRGKLAFFLAGAISAFLLDPASGSGRRTWVNERLNPLLRLLGQTKKRATTGDLRARAGEAIHQASTQVAPVAQSVQHVMSTVQAKVGDAAGTIGASISQTSPTDGATSELPQLEDQVTPIRNRKEAQSAESDASANGSEVTPANVNRNTVTGVSENEEAASPAEIAAELAPAAVEDPIPEGDIDERHPTETINDPTLVARVESELFRDQAIPKGKLNIDAMHGVVTVRGTVDEEMGADIIERTRAVEGVRDVVDMLQRE